MTEIDVRVVAKMAQAYGMLYGSIEGLIAMALEPEAGEVAQGWLDRAGAAWDEAVGLLDKTSGVTFRGGGAAFGPASRSILLGDRDPVTGGPRLTCETGGKECSD